ncbi:hypothetical protein LguiB_021705 [Lonicera macranthoides]
MKLIRGKASEKGTPGSLSRLKPERIQVLPQDGTYHHGQMESMNSVNLDSQHREDELNREINVLKINDGKVLRKEQIGAMNQDQELEVAVGFSVGIIPNITKEGRPTIDDIEKIIRPYVPRFNCMPLTLATPSVGRGCSHVDAGDVDSGSCL